MASTSLADLLDSGRKADSAALRIETLLKEFSGLKGESWEMAVEDRMLTYANALQFEEATFLRDELARYRTGGSHEQEEKGSE